MRSPPALPGEKQEKRDREKKREKREDLTREIFYERERDKNDGGGISGPEALVLFDFLKLEACRFFSILGIVRPNQPLPIIYYWYRLVG
jgi:hypothetical protein